MKASILMRVARMDARERGPRGHREHSSLGRRRARRAGLAMRVLPLVIFMCLLVLAHSRKKKQTPKPAGPWTPTLRSEPLLQEFEGVDFEYLPKPIAWKYTDCYSQFIICVRTFSRQIPVCAWDSKTNHFSDYYSTCQIELVNCRSRSAHRPGVRIVYNGDGRSCRHYLRLGGHMLDNYFGLASLRRTFYRTYLRLALELFLRAKVQQYSQSEGD